ncbi:MAG: SRPBCC family protein [Chloroflexaceae bacterium]|nr:SRPBCC family protein [Chloroflexaceae bacterium]
MLQYMGASVSALIAAKPEAVWAIVSDLRRHPELAGSGQVTKIEMLTPEPIGLGSAVSIRTELEWLPLPDGVTRGCLRADAPLYLADSLPGTPPFAQIWQFELLPHGGGTLIENSVILPYTTPVFFPFSLLGTAVGQLEANTMLPTLRNLAQMLNVPEPEHFDTFLYPADNLITMMPSLMVASLPWVAGASVLGLSMLGRRGG